MFRVSSKLERRKGKGPGVKGCALACAVLLLTAGCVHAAPQILFEQEAHVGEEVVLSIAPSSAPSDASIEWAVSGNVNPILLRAGGRECAFTPVDTKPIEVMANVRDRSGSLLGTVNQTVTPREFNIVISVVEDEPVLLWDSVERTEVSTDALLARRPVHLRAVLEPPFRGQQSFNWTVDASTAMLSDDSAPDILINRSETGDSEIAVSAFNAAGVRLGAGECVVSVTLPYIVYEESERNREAWEDWQRAQSLWDEKQYSEAVASGQKALSLSARDPDIANGYKAMAANYARYLRAEELRAKGEEQRGQKLYDDALKNFRLAHVIWPVPGEDQTIQELERDLDEIRILQQKAQWLRDTANAYDQEGLFEDALDYYAQSLAVVSSDAVESRMERIKNRLALISDADKYAGEGNVLEREGQLEEAINHYSASIVSNPDATLRQHIEELQSVVSRRKRQATALYKEGLALQKKGSAPEALQRYRESQEMWEMPEAKQKENELARSVKNNLPVRKPEDFGIGTKADAARLIRSGDTMYLQRRLEDAAALYRKGLAIAPSDDLKAWLGKIEATLRDQKAAKAANVQIREANALYKAGKINEALTRYRESLATHPNAEVESFLKKNTGQNAAGSDKK